MGIAGSVKDFLGVNIFSGIGGVDVSATISMVGEENKVAKWGKNGGGVFSIGGVGIDSGGGGLELVGGAENSLRSNILEVIAAGPTCEMVKEGDTVMVDPNSEGLIINLDEGEFVMVNEFQVCGILPS